eukprot:SAG31_NODE_1368_length_8614_cov_12.018203_4_plen_139_part_00
MHNNVKLQNDTRQGGQLCFSGFTSSNTAFLFAVIVPSTKPRCRLSSPVIQLSSFAACSCKNISRKDFAIAFLHLYLHLSRIASITNAHEHACPLGCLTRWTQGAAVRKLWAAHRCQQPSSAHDKSKKLILLCCHGRYD